MKKIFKMPERRPRCLAKILDGFIASSLISNTIGGGGAAYCQEGPVSAKKKKILVPTTLNAGLKLFPVTYDKYEYNFW